MFSNVFSKIFNTLIKTGSDIDFYMDLGAKRIEFESRRKHSLSKISSKNVNWGAPGSNPQSGAAAKSAWPARARHVAGT